MTLVMIKLIGRGTGGLPSALDQSATTRLDRAFAEISDGIADKFFLVGATLTLADMQMSYCMAVLDAGGMLQDHPALSDYWQRLQTANGFRRVLAVGGPLVLRSRSAPA